MTEFTDKAIRNLMLGKYLGGGVGRQVYVLGTDPTKVIKVEQGSGQFQNIKEWEFWWDNKDEKEIAKWLAPCKFISPDGSVLIQDRTEPLMNYKKLPEKLPYFLTDIKKSNFGVLKNKIVCHDYGIIRYALEYKLVKADWWD